MKSYEHKPEGRGQEYEAFRQRAMDAFLADTKAKIISGEGSKDEEYDVQRLIIPGLRPQLPEHKEALDSVFVDRERIQQEIYELKQKQEKLDREARSIELIPVLFDSPSFNDVQKKLWELNSGRITKIKIGEKEYTIAQLAKILTQVREYSLKLHQEGKAPGDPKEHQEFLASIGVTREKVSPFSGLGFRECMVQCIAQDHPAVWHKSADQL